MGRVTINFLDDNGPVAEHPRRSGVYVEDARGVPELRAVIYCARFEPAGWTARDLDDAPVLDAGVMQRLWLDHPTHSAQRRRLRELVIDHFRREAGLGVNPHREIIRRGRAPASVRRALVRRLQRGLTPRPAD